MKRFVKISVAVLATLFVVLLLAITITLKAIDTNQIKKQIQHLVSKNTGYDLTISGDIDWRIFPNIGFTAKDIAIKNNKGERLSHIDKATTRIQLLPLLQKQVAIETLQLHKPTIYITKDKQSNLNWRTIKNDPPKNAAPTTQEKPVQKHTTDFVVKNIEIYNGDLFFSDAKSNSKHHISQLNIHGTQVQLGKPFPLTGRFHAQNDEKNSPTLVSFKTEIEASDSGDAWNFEKIGITIGKTNIRGDFSVSQKPTLKILFHLDVSELNADQWFNSQANTKPNAQKNISSTSNGMKSDHSETPLITVNGAVLHLPHVQGILSIKTLILKKLLLTDVQINVDTPQRNVFKIAPLSANAYNGRINNEATLDFRSSVPKFDLFKSGSNLNAGALIEAYTGKPSLSGVLNYTGDLTTHGNTKSQLIKNLNGKMKVALNEGQLQKIDLSQAANIVNTFLKTKTSGPVNSGFTKFSDLVFSTTIVNGVVSTNDLLLTSPLIVAKGNGNINLVDQSLALKFLVTPLGNSTIPVVKNLQENLGGIPFKLTGTFDNYHFMLDETAILQQGANTVLEKLQKKPMEKMEKTLDKLQMKNGAPIKLDLKKLIPQ